MSLTAIDAYGSGSGNSDLSLIINSSQYKGPLDALTSTSGKAPTIITPGCNSTSADGLVLACRRSGAGDVEIYRWNGSTYVNQTITGATPGTSGGAWTNSCVSNDGVWVVIAYNAGNSIYLYKYNGAGYTLTNAFAAGYATSAVTFSPDETQLACTGGSASNYACRLYSFNNSTGALALLATSTSTGDGHQCLDWLGNYILQSWCGGVTRGRVLNATTLAVVCSFPAAGSVSQARWNSSGSHFYHVDGSNVCTVAFNGSTATLVNSYALAFASQNMDVIVPKTRDYLLVINTGGAANNYYSVAGGVLSALTAPTPVALAAVFTGLP